jgi:hypothetical protein
LEKIEAQRMEVAEISEQWQKPVAVMDIGMKAVRFIRNHPALISGGAAALLAWRRKGVVGLTQKAWRLLYLYPAAVTLGLNYLFSALRSQSEERNSEVDH